MYKFSVLILLALLSLTVTSLAAQTTPTYNLSIMRVPQAHGITQGHPSVIIAIVDSGVDTDHPELTGRLLPGYDFRNGDAYPEDDHGHGTAAASVAAGAYLGVCPKCRILPIKATGTNLERHPDDVAAAIRYAADNGAQIINLSLARKDAFQQEQDAITYAHERGSIIVVAAGNGGTSDLRYPAGYAHVIAVSGTNPQDTLWPGSSTGAHVLVSAPAEWVYAATLNGGYKNRSGTSLAAPAVSGLLGLLLSQNRTAQDAISVMVWTVRDLGPCGRDSWYGYGRIDAFDAVRHDMAMGWPCTLYFPAMPQGRSFSPAAI